MKTNFYYFFFGLLFLSLVGVAGGLHYRENIKNNPTWFNSLQTSLIKKDISRVPTVGSETISKAVKEISKKISPKTPCEATLHYSFGKLDSKHNITPERLHSLMKRVEKIWEEPTGFNLLEYKEGANLKINFIFDGRQQQSNISQSLNGQLIKLNSSQKNLSTKYNDSLLKYKKYLNKYNKFLKELKKETAEYNNEVIYWNKQGTVTPEKYEELNNFKDKLDNKKKELDKKRKKINDLAKKLNALIKKEHSVVDKYNSKIITYQNKYGKSKQFNQGDYSGNNINIYEFKNKDDLVLVLAHEFGHALGLGHVKNPKSIMYYLMGEQNLKNPQLTAEDLNALKTICNTTFN